MSRHYIGKIPVDFLSRQSAMVTVGGFFNNGGRQIVTINSIMFNYALSDAELLTAIQNAALVVPDSIGIVAAGLIFGARKNGDRLQRVPGIDLMLDICSYAVKHNLSVFLLGAKPDVIPETAMVLKNMFPGLKIAGFYHGYFSEKEEKNVIKEINGKKPDILFVGLDVPRQEKWIYRNLPRIKTHVVMGVGGSFDVISGKLKRAPQIMRSAGLEWLFRFIQEPWRIMRIKDLPLFFLKLIKMRFSHG